VQIAAGLVTVLNLCLSLGVVVRLLRLGRGRGVGPELALALFFLLAIFLGGGILMSVYASWADPALGVPEAFEGPLLCAALLLSSTGNAALCLFTAWTFHPGRPWARHGVAAVVAILALGLALQAATEGFAIRVLPGHGYWISFAGRAVGPLWVAIESLRYWRRLRRRVALGMGDPLVANRFFLWGVWSSALLLNAFADLAARIAYFLRTGSTTDWDPALGLPVVLATIAASSVIGALSVVTLFLAFFPPRRFRRWIATRAPAPEP
jgi:hypothetical protein